MLITKSLIACPVPAMSFVFVSIVRMQKFQMTDVKHTTDFFCILVGTVMVEPQAVEEKRLRFQGPEFGSRKRHKCKGTLCEKMLMIYSRLRLM